MSSHKGHKRKRGKNPMIEGDPDLAQAVTRQTISETHSDGTTVQRRVWVSIDAPTDKVTTVEKEVEVPTMDYEPAHISPPPTEGTHSYRKQRDYLEQYINRIDDLLDACLSREAMPAGTGMCRHCEKDVFAIWRCRDCMLPTPRCRACMQIGHRENLFHRIEKWNGGYFRPAKQWEVSTYLLVQHHVGEAVCETLKRWTEFLEHAEESKDNAEQDQLCEAMSCPGAPVPAPAPYCDQDDDWNMEEVLDIGGEEDYEEDLEEEELDHPTSQNTYLAGNVGTAPPSALPGTYIRIVHSNGLHHIAMISCQCQGDDVLPLDLFAARLLPASFKRIKTVFTAEVLDLYRLCNLELKASAYQFYQLLRRLTLPMAPAEKLKWARYAGTDKKANQVGAGNLAIYCPACPQPGINIPDDWKDDPARHMGDVWLSEGSGMMPRNAEYMDFLASAIERLMVTPCENTFRAIMNALQASKLCDITGLVSIACGRHGCYAPQSLVDLFKGEQQKNVDFALLNALKSTHVEPEQGVLLIYDIACQYFIHLQDRIASWLPFGLDIDAAIGLFHVHAHKDQCFFQYTTSFIPGAAIVAGEILESLWSSLNAISPTARTATLAHRTLGIIATLCRSYQTAVDMLDHAKNYYQNLTDQAGMTAVEKWTQDIERAESMRKHDVKVMDVYAAKLDDTPALQPLAPGMPRSALASWMELSLAVEEKQLEIQAKLIESEREQLTALLSELKTAMHAAGVTEINGANAVLNVSLELWDEIVNEPVPTGPNNLPDPAETQATADTTPPSIYASPIEVQGIPLPSNGNVAPMYRDLEISHRVVHADHHLNRIQELIAEKSFQFSHVIRVSPRKAVNTHSRATVKKLNLKILVHCRLYSQCRARLVILGTNPATLSRLKVLTPADVKASTAIMNPNEPGSTRLTLSWLWQTARVLWRPTSLNVSLLLYGSYHRARAQCMRWEEQVTLTSYEMQWTVRYFLHKSCAWATPSGTGIPTRTSAGQFRTAGSIAYAKRQHTVWEEIMRKADHTFARYNVAYKSPL
ncbi:hypothetical protein BYT27DRAFT_7224958 [Phlegmacium glaucopus]|nr:hypothetical protein BYT27DRAFT_7224958 [Phlegmacium glaucopus]